MNSLLTDPVRQEKRDLPHRRKVALLATLALVLAIPLSASAGTYEVSPDNTRVGFKVRNLKISWVSGQFEAFSGTVVYDPADPTGIAIDVTVQIASVNTKDAKRDRHLRSDDFFDADRFPTMTFVSRSAEVTGEGLAVTGDLTIRGITRSTVLAVIGPGDESPGPDGRPLRKASGSAEVLRADFGMDWKIKGIAVGKEVFIAIDAVLVRTD